MTQVELAFVNGRVRTLDPSLPAATAVAVGDGTILAAGTDAEIRELCGARTEIVDLRGAAVVPGITDSHLHPFMGAEDARGADLMDARTLDDVRGLVAAERRRCAPGEWVLGFGLDYDVFRDSGIHGALVDDAVEGSPAFLMFVDFHTALATPRALALAGVDGPRTFEQNAEIVCAGGTPTGELRESAATDLIQEAVPALTAAERYRLYVDALHRFAAVGITGVHAMDGDLSSLELLRELEANGDLVTRIVAPFWIKPETDEAEWAALLPHRDARGRRFTGGVAKFFVDGVIDAGTGWLYEPDTEGEGALPFWPDPARYRAAVARFAGAGFQCATHATGDRAVREALDAYRAAGAAPGVRHRIEHIETLQPHDLPRFAAEGVVASMQAQHMMELDPDRDDNWSRRLGRERCERAFPIRSLRESGAVVALGSDWPVARFDPRIGLAATRLRRPPGARDRRPYDDEALDGLAALEGYTSAAAYTAGQEHRLGRVKAGFAADLTVFAEDPVDCDADDLLALPVLLTVVDGEIVYRAD
ncbi:MAG TPA: amidohydrolase family protein [Gaiellaceae bacterium]|nr:amidohydrolase family protein [Gaiellaceae bacterium]